MFVTNYTIKFIVTKNFTHNWCDESLVIGEKHNIICESRYIPIKTYQLNCYYKNILRLILCKGTQL